MCTGGDYKKNLGRHYKKKKKNTLLNKKKRETLKKGVTNPILVVAASLSLFSSSSLTLGTLTRTAPSSLLLKDHPLVSLSLEPGDPPSLSLGFISLWGLFS
jgi:hypothetical protein